VINVLLAEDHNIVRNGIRSLLDKQPDVNLVGEAVDGLEVLKYVDDGAEVDVVLTDINMPQLNGLALIRELKKRSPKIKVLILTMLDHENYVMQAVNNGAFGYLLKRVNEEELMFAIRHVNAGNTYVCSEITDKLLIRLSNISSESIKELKVTVDLSKRELEILILIAEGFTNNEIAEKLFTSRRTVEGHRQNLLEKTGARNTATLIRFAVKNGLVE
jgi:DNA-binding NarL/FixJ family response regulator